MSTLRTMSSSTRPFRLPRCLDEERHRGDLLEVRLGHLPALLHAHLEGDAVVGDDDEDAPVEDPGALHAAHDQPELAVGVAHLEQMAQMVVVGEQRVVEAARRG